MGALGCRFMSLELILDHLNSMNTFSVCLENMPENDE
jgi:hypothetical protein